MKKLDMSNEIVKLYTGGCRVPDFVGLGYFSQYREIIEGTRANYKQIEDAQSCYLTTTDNRIEILAAIYGLESIIDNIASQKIKLDQIDFFTTSKYLYNAVSLGWIYKWKSNNWMKTEWNGLPPQPIKNSDLWKELID